MCLAVLAACAGDSETDDAAPATPAADFRTEAAALCGPVAEQEERLLDAGGIDDLREATRELGRAELQLAADLRALDASPDVAAEVDAYADMLERYSKAHTRSVEQTESAEPYAAIVQAARIGVSLDEAAAAADLPPDCPPAAGVNVHNGLFVAKANRGCHRLREDVSSAGPIETPRTAEEVALVLDLAQRLTAGIARAVERAAPSDALELPVKQIIRASKKRFRALGDLRQTFAEADFGAYKEASRELRRISRKADRKMLSLGLIACVKAFGEIPL